MAVTFNDMAIRLNPTWAALHNDLGVLLADQKKWRDAEEAYRRALQLKPGEGRYYANLAGALLPQGRRAEAIQAAEKAIRLGKRNHWVYRALGLTP